MNDDCTIRIVAADAQTMVVVTSQACAISEVFSVDVAPELTSCQQADGSGV